MKVSQYEKMIETPIPKLIINLSIPTIIGMLVTNIYNMVDTAFVGMLGTSASGAVGVVFGFMAIVQAFGFMFGNGSGSMLSRALGAKNTKEASCAASTGFFLSLLAGAAIEVTGFLLIDRIVMLLGATPTIAPYAESYIRCILLAVPFMTSSFTLNNILRYEGRAMLGMIGMMVGAVLNIALDPILMFGAGLGIVGAGTATAISQVVSFCILLFMALSGRTQTKLSIRNLRFQGGFALTLIGTGFPSLLRQGLTSIATIILNMESGVYGDAAVAAMSIANRVGFFVFAIALGIGQGYQPVCGFNYGAKKYRRLREGYRFTALTAELVVLILGLLAFLFAPQVIAVFRNDPAVVAIGVRPLRLQLAGMLTMPPCMATEMTMQSIGKKLAASLLSALRSGLLFIPLLLILSEVRGLSGIQEAQPLAFVLAFIPTMAYTWYFFRKLPKEDEETMEHGGTTPEV